MKRFFTVKSILTTNTGIVPLADTLTIGANMCLPPPDVVARIRCQTTPPRHTTWTLNGGPIAGNEYTDITQSGVYTCTTSDGCGNILTDSSEVLRKSSLLHVYIMV